MSKKHYLLLLLITFLFGSAYPVQKLIFNQNVPPILMGSLRMLIVFICLIPFWKFKIPEKKYFIPLLGFSLSMGTGVFLFMNLALQEATIVSPIIIGAQLSIPFAILISSLFLGEKISYKKWSLVFLAFIGIFLIGYDPNLKGEILALLYTTIMALCYALAQVFSRYLKELDVKLTNTFMGITGCLSLLIFSIIFEGSSIYHFQNINFSTWLLILHSAILVSLVAHMSMFYLYKFYPVGQVMPFYSLFPIFGIIQTFFIFGEIPPLLTLIGGTIVLASVYYMQKIR